MKKISHYLARQNSNF